MSTKEMTFEMVRRISVYIEFGCKEFKILCVMYVLDGTVPVYKRMLARDSEIIAAAPNRCIK